MVWGWVLCRILDYFNAKECAHAKGLRSVHEKWRDRVEALQTKISSRWKSGPEKVL